MIARLPCYRVEDLEQQLGLLNAFAPYAEKRWPKIERKPNFLTFPDGHPFVSQRCSVVSPRSPRSGTACRERSKRLFGVKDLRPAASMVDFLHSSPLDQVIRRGPLPIPRSYR